MEERETRLGWFLVKCLEILQEVRREEGKMESSGTLPVRSCYHVVPMTSISSPFSLFPEAANEGSKVQEATCIRAQDSGYTLEQPVIRLLPSSSNSGRAKTGSKELGVG